MVGYLGLISQSKDCGKMKKCKRQKNYILISIFDIGKLKDRQWI